MTSFPLPILAFVENNDGMADRPLLNEQIKALQENAELTNEVAARIMGIPLRTYMRWRSGQSEPGVDGHWRWVANCVGNVTQPFSRGAPPRT